MIPATSGTSTPAAMDLAAPNDSPLLSTLESPSGASQPPLIRLPEPAPIVEVASEPSKAGALPLSLLSHLLRQLSELKLAQLADLLPALRILAIALAAGLVVKLTAAVLGSLNEWPLLGGLLELVGLIRFVQLLSTHALKQKKRAELLARIQDLKRQLIG